MFEILQNLELKISDKSKHYLFVTLSIAKGLKPRKRQRFFTEVQNDTEKSTFSPETSYEVVCGGIIDIIEQITNLLKFAV